MSIHKTVWHLQSIFFLNFASYTWSVGPFQIKNQTFIEDCRNQTILWIDLKFRILADNCYIINILQKTGGVTSQWNVSTRRRLTTTCMCSSGSF